MYVSFSEKLRGAVRAAIFIAVMVSSSFALAVNSGVTMQGRIIKPNGDALEDPNVRFRIQIRTPGSENCLMYEEAQALNMTSSKGVFSLTVNDGSRRSP